MFLKNLQVLYSQGFQEVLSLLGILSVLGVRLCRDRRVVQGLLWCPPFLRDQTVPALRGVLVVQGGLALPWDRSLLMVPEVQLLQEAQVDPLYLGNPGEHRIRSTSAYIMIQSSVNHFFRAATFIRALNFLHLPNIRTYNFSSLARVSRQSILSRGSLEKQEVIIVR